MYFIEDELSSVDLPKVERSKGTEVFLLDNIE